MQIFKWAATLSKFFHGGSQIFVCFPLSLAVSEISANSFFFKNSKNFGNFDLFFNFSRFRVVITYDVCDFKFSEILTFWKRFENVVLWTLKMHMIPNFGLFRCISYRFRDKHFLHKNSKINICFQIFNPWPRSIEY